MVSRRLPQTRLFAAFMAVLTACGAALFAHVAIDIAGDVLLAHDTYDGLDHQSRGEMVAGGLIALVGLLLRLVWRALAEARGGYAARRLRFEEMFGRSAWRFALAVAFLALPALMAMEYVDVSAAGGRIDDVTDLLGGSLPLGSSLTALAAALCAATVRRIARFVLSKQDVLVAVIGRLIVSQRRLAVATSAYATPSRRRPSHRGRSILSRRSGKRGPPALLV